MRSPTITARNARAGSEAMFEFLKTFLAHLFFFCFYMLILYGAGNFVAWVLSVTLTEALMMIITTSSIWYVANIPSSRR